MPKVNSVKKKRGSIVFCSAFLSGLDSALGMTSSFPTPRRTFNFPTLFHSCPGGANADKQQASIAQTAKLALWVVANYALKKLRRGARPPFAQWPSLFAAIPGEFKLASVDQQKLLVSFSKVRPRLNGTKPNKRIGAAMNDRALKENDVFVQGANLTKQGGPANLGALATHHGALKDAHSLIEKYWRCQDSRIT
ncbi:MAG: hypothetical protein V4713_01865 [Pseudomonadota bacterium]